MIFLSTCRQPRFWQRWLRVICARIALVFALTSLTGEFCYNLAFGKTDLYGQLEAAKLTGIIYPLERRTRILFAQRLMMQTQIDTQPWLIAATFNALRNASKLDPNAADILANLLAYEMATNKIEEARATFTQFKRVAGTSQLFIRYDK